MSVQCNILWSELQLFLVITLCFRTTKHDVSMASDHVQIGSLQLPEHTGGTKDSAFLYRKDKTWDNNSTVGQFKIRFIEGRKEWARDISCIGIQLDQLLC